MGLFRHARHDLILIVAQRIPYILQVPMALYCLIAVQFVPETPRFLVSKGRDQEALDFLAEYHGNGDYEDPLVLFEFNEIREAINREKAAKAEQWSQILKSRANVHRLGLAVLMIFSANVSNFPVFKCTNVLTAVRKYVVSRLFEQC